MKSLFCFVMLFAATAYAEKAVCELNGTKGSQVAGKVTFTQEKDGVHVVADVTNLSPGEHGFHIHEKGDCNAPDGSSAGGHFNPGGHKHGGPDAAERHAGDLGNLVADKSGKAHYDRVDKGIKLSGPDTIIGRGIIVHEKLDDLNTQPTGNTGGRLACGAIVESKE